MTAILTQEASGDKQRFPEIDVLKCFCIFTVVYIHSISTSFTVTNSLGVFFSAFTRFAVPGLFFAAGFLFDKSVLSTSQIIQKKLIRILPPYIFCSFCIQFLNVPGLSVSLADLDAQQLLFNLAFGNTLGIYYFVFVLFYLYLFSLLLRRIDAMWVLVMWGASFLLLLFFVEKVVFQGHSLLVLFRHPYFHLFSYLSGWVYCLYRTQIISMVKSRLLLIMITILMFDIVNFLFAGMHGGSFVPSLLLTQLHIYLFIALLLLIGIKTIKFQKTIQFFSNCSFGIYLLHFPIVRSCQLVYPEIAADYSFWYAFIAWFTGVSISVLLILAIKKIAGRYSVHLVGY